MYSVGFIAPMTANPLCNTKSVCVTVCVWECVKREFLYHRGFKVDLLSVLNPLPGVDRPVFIMELVLLGEAWLFL